MVLKRLDRKTEIQTWLNEKYLCEIRARIYLLKVRTEQERDERKTIHE